MVLVGAYSMLYPEGRWVRNWVSPKKWKEDPEAAAREQVEAASLTGAALFLAGCVLLVVGLLV